MGLTDGVSSRRFLDIRQRIFIELEPVAVETALACKRAADHAGGYEAVERLHSIRDKLVVHDLNLAASPGELREFAETLATRCKRAMGERATKRLALAACLRLAARYGLDSPNTKNTTIEERLEKCGEPRYWFRVVRTKAARMVEQVLRDLGAVSKVRGTYASNQTVTRRARIKSEQRYYLENTYLSNNEGQSFPLAQLAQKSVSNPEIRRAELMVRMRGFEEVATACGDKALFVTLTTPSRMHRSLSSGAKNPKFDGTSPKDAQQYLCTVWNRIRAKLHRTETNPYGFRIAEPHHDGTPHWHFLLFAPAHCHKSIIDTFHRYGLEDSPNEAGAQKHRVKIVEIDPDKGSPAGYIAKYVAKNVDGAHIETDNYGKDSVESAQRIEAWARTWGIRQFQQIGGPPVSLWRELRRLREPVDSELESARVAADSSDWAAFVYLMGGTTTPRKLRPFAVALVPLPDADELEPLGIAILEKRTGMLTPTRKYRWHVEAATEMGGNYRPPSADPWTCVNNCTN